MKYEPRTVSFVEGIHPFITHTFTQRKWELTHRALCVLLCVRMCETAQICHRIRSAKTKMKRDDFTLPLSPSLGKRATNCNFDWRKGIKLNVIEWKCRGMLPSSECDPYTRISSPCQYRFPFFIRSSVASGPNARTETFVANRFKTDCIDF